MGWVRVYSSSFQEVAVSNDPSVLDELIYTNRVVCKPKNQLLTKVGRILSVSSVVFGGLSRITTIEGTSATIASHHQEDVI